jgi:hypothetical protein
MPSLYTDFAKERLVSPGLSALRSRPKLSGERVCPGCSEVHLSLVRDERFQDRAVACGKEPNVEKQERDIQAFRSAVAENLEKEELNAAQVFLDAFERSYKRRRAAECLQLVRSLMSTLNQTQSAATELARCLQKTGFGQTDDTNAPVGVETSPASSPLYSVASRQYLGRLLRGKHQGLMRLLLNVGDLDGALEYLQMLPPAKMLCSALMKECIDRNDIAGLKRLLQVC